MGNEFSAKSPDNDDERNKAKPAYAEFFSSAGKTIGQASGVVCGSLSDTFEEADREDRAKSHSSYAASSKRSMHGFENPEDDASLQSNPMSQLFARAMLNEVTANPNTMTPAKMADREKRLLKAQHRANSASSNGMRAIGGQGSMRAQLQDAKARIVPPNMLSEHRAQVRGDVDSSSVPHGKHTVTIGLMLSRRDGVTGHLDTVTRQTAFDFNELQDRDYTYVSSTDASGWRAGGGEKGGPPITSDMKIASSLSDDNEFDNQLQGPKLQQPQKIPAPDMVHIPIIHIDCDSEGAVNAVIAAIARGEVFIPHMSVMPEALGVNGISPPDLVVRFGCERNDDFPPEEWPNWCLEFMHNQLYEYFSDMGARWMKRPFQITLAKKVRWKTVKHMNKFFAHSETVTNSWREKGPRYLDPQLAHIDGGATPEEVARPHGIYLLRNGKPTNYFAPNFEPPYTTKMTRSLLLNVIAKSWDKKRRDWSTAPIPIVTPSLLLSTMCGCAEPNQGGFIAREATNHFSPIGGGTFFGDGNYDYDLNLNGIVEQELQGMKMTREDSGITRSQINEVDQRGRSRMVAHQKPDGTSSVSVRSSSASQRTESSAGLSSDHYVSSAGRSSADNYAFNQQQNDETFNQQHNEQFNKQRNDQNSSQQHNAQFDKQHNEQNFNQQHNEQNFNQQHNEQNFSQSPHAMSTNTEELDIFRELNYSNESDTDEGDFPNEEDVQELGDFTSPPQRNASPADYATPLMNNRNTHNQQKPPQDRPSAKITESQSVPASPSRVRDIQNAAYEGDRARSLSPTEANGTQISIGESQTTVPVMNRSSATFIEQERERRKLREVEREKERRKIDELEMAIQEKLRVHEEKKKNKATAEGAPARIESTIEVKVS